MRKILLSLGLLTICSSLFAEPYALLQSHWDKGSGKKKKYALDYIVHKKSVPVNIYKLKNGKKASLPLANNAMDIAAVYNKWFENLQTRIEEQKRTDLDFMKDIIEFGLSKEVVKELKDKNKTDSLQVFLANKNDEFWQGSSEYTEGFFQKTKKNMEIYIKEGVRHKPDNILLHELGHTLAISDSYYGGASAEDLNFSSDPRPSLMEYAPFLTCDDADALASAIFITLKQEDSNVKDFKMDSFCDYDEVRVQIKNGRQINRKPLLTQSERKYYITEFCTDTGEMKAVTEIDPFEPSAWKKKEKKQCDSIPLDDKNFEPLKYKWVDENAPGCLKVDLTKENQTKKTPEKGKSVCEYAYVISREISFGKDIAKTLLQVKDSNGALVFAFGIIDDKHDFIYVPAEDFAIWFDKKNYNKYAVLRQNIVSVSDKKLSETENPYAFFNKFKNFFGEPEIPQGLFSHQKTDFFYYLGQADKWHKYLEKNYPYKDISEEIKPNITEITDFGKQISANF